MRKAKGKDRPSCTPRSARDGEARSHHRSPMPCGVSTSAFKLQRNSKAKINKLRQHTELLCKQWSAGVVTAADGGGVGVANIYSIKRSVFGFQHSAVTVNSSPDTRVHFSTLILCGWVVTATDVTCNWRCPWEPCMESFVPWSTHVFNPCLLKALIVCKRGWGHKGWPDKDPAPWKLLMESGDRICCKFISQTGQSMCQWSGQEKGLEEFNRRAGVRLGNQGRFSRKWLPLELSW